MCIWRDVHIFTLGDVSYKNMVKDAIRSLRRPFAGQDILNDLNNVRLEVVNTPA